MFQFILVDLRLSSRSRVQKRAYLQSLQDSFHVAPGVHSLPTGMGRMGLGVVLVPMQAIMVQMGRPPAHLQLLQSSIHTCKDRKVVKFPGKK